MNLEITPSQVHRSAAEVADAATTLGKAGSAATPDPGNQGFQFSDALRQFSAKMAEITTKEASDTKKLAGKITDSVTVIERTEADAAEASAQLKQSFQA